MFVCLFNLHTFNKTSELKLSKMKLMILELSFTKTTAILLLLLLMVVVVAVLAPLLITILFSSLPFFVNYTWCFS